MYLYVPGAMNRSDELWPRPKLSVCPSPVRKTMLCCALSRFVQVTVSPAAMNSTSGLNAKPEISTLCVAAVAGEAARLGVTLSSEQTAVCERLASELIERNTSVNLTAITEPQDIAR